MQSRPSSHCLLLSFRHWAKGVIEIRFALTSLGKNADAGRDRLSGMPREFSERG